MIQNKTVPQRPAPTPGWAVYLRTSTDQHQKPEYSRTRQRVIIQSAVLDHSSFSVYAEYVDVLSGKNPDRPAYQRMLADARRGKFSHVVVECADRFGRDDREALRAIDELHAYGVSVRFANAPEIDAMDPDERVLVTLTFALARRESTLMGIRVKGGLKAKRLSGGYVGRAPDGYLNASGQTECDQRAALGRISHWIEPDPQRAHIWQEAWELLLSDQVTLNEIAEILHFRGYRDRNGKPFLEIGNSGLTRIFTSKLVRAFQNWTYAGWVVSEHDRIDPKTIRGTWEPLITTEAFEAGLGRLSKLQPSPPTNHHV